MKTTEILAREETPDGEELLLLRRDSVYTLRVAGLELMTSRGHGSEEILARLACEALVGRPRPRVLVGGLGFGYTLRATLDSLSPDSTVVVCELFDSLLEWNRGPVGELAGRPLHDPRVTALRSDVQEMFGSSEKFDAIILDIDNGPWGLTQRSNDDLYSAAGIDRLARTVTPEGVLTVWSAEASPEFEDRLRQSGFDVRTESVRARPGITAPHHTIFVAIRR